MGFSTGCIKICGRPRLTKALATAGELVGARTADGTAHLRTGFRQRCCIFVFTVEIFCAPFRGRSIPTNSKVWPWDLLIVNAKMFYRKLKPFKWDWQISWDHRYPRYMS
ncbi:hypothetical protein EVAR_14038_1 [Eumeta japonica]|uniref:Uncharacterized protein n=1 Tax=Eumeta variegata TaxID=151549 RepID=A0A4C1SQ32_EUMVA|nr:hypothetical protein EVAR_14038_1 [Eumeta japonica]